MKTAEARAPGRVNLIGEHTDYNGGFIMPCAIGYETRVKAQARLDDRVTISSPFEDAATQYYIRGVIAELLVAGVDVPGLSLQIDSTLPIGAGLSSSASLEIAVALAALAISGAHMDPMDLAKLALRAEISYAHTQCGIMDQFAAVFGQKGFALFLDTRTLEYEELQIPKECAIVICNTMVKHQLASGEYNQRRHECEESVALLSQEFPGVTQLRDVSIEQLKAARGLLTSKLYNRALHVISENERVLRAREALRTGNVAAFGDLMNDSHESLRALYEVSSKELDLMVTLACEAPYVYGSRMTGGGFGGCTVNLVEAEYAAEFRAYISDAYHRKTGIVPQIYDGTPSAGAQLVA